MRGFAKVGEKFFLWIIELEVQVLKGAAGFVPDIFGRRKKTWVIRCLEEILQCPLIRFDAHIIVCNVIYVFRNVFIFIFVPIHLHIVFIYLRIIFKGRFKTETCPEVRFFDFVDWGSP